MDSDFDHLPIIPHEHVAEVKCCGCLMVRLREGQADILCNECGDVIRTVPVGEVDSTMMDLSPLVKSVGKPDARNGHVRFDERRR